MRSDWTYCMGGTAQSRRTVIGDGGGVELGHNDSRLSGLKLSAAAASASRASLGGRRTPDRIAGRAFVDARERAVI